MEGLDCFALLAMTENVRRFWALFFYKSDNRYIFQFCSIISAICRIINKSCIVAKVTYGAAMAKKYPEQVLKETVVLLMAIRQEQEVSYQVLAREAGSGSLGSQVRAGIASAKHTACSPVPQPISSTTPCVGR